MLLAIDIGNTQTVIGVFDGADLRYMWRVATNKADTSDELRLKAKPLLESEGVPVADIDGSIVALAAMLGEEPLICSADTAAGLFQASYDNPSEIGADRVADAVAARILYGAPVIVVDFGTATNLEVIDAQGLFVGGIIAPGLETSAAALFSHATKLPTIELVDPGTPIGKNTVHAMQSGIVYGEADRVDGFVQRVFEELGYEAPVVATGGLATTMAPLCKTVTHVSPELTLEGLRFIYEARG